MVKLLIEITVALMDSILNNRYPPFPETIAFNNDRKKSGIACHHPKLIVLQREDKLRIVITSANLVEKQVCILFVMRYIILMWKVVLILLLY